jgi:hypothetical protein
LVFFLKELIDFSISQYETAKKVFLKSKSMPNQYFKPNFWDHFIGLTSSSRQQCRPTVYSNL